MKKLTQNWHLTRILQLSMGVLLIGNFLFYRPDGITLVFGLLLLAQAAFNISCVGGACTTSRYNGRIPKNQPDTDDAYIDEIV